MFLIGSTACKALRICKISRGPMRSAATLEMRRSKSPTWAKWSWISSRSSGLRKKASTTFSRSLICLMSLSGKSSQRCNVREPMGVTVRSNTSSKLLPSSSNGLINSRLRTVKRSNRT